MPKQAFHPKPEAGNPPYVIAHRGISAKAPENTLASFTLAVNAPGIDMIELDVRLTKDDQVIVLHDRTLQRTSTGNGIARKYTLNDLGSYDAGSWFNPMFKTERIPTLKQVLELVGRSRWVNVEIKSDPLHTEPRGLIERKVLDVVHECGLSETVFFSSFDHHLIGNLKSMAPHVTTGVLYNLFRDFGRPPSKLARRADASIFICAKGELQQSMIDDARRHGLAVYVYTLNSVKDAQKMIELGVDGIISDNADEIVSLVNQHK
ncbi:MAG TPA: glycerophosphodiester phosphodiesterase family protein [Bacteroidota bacterium]